MIDLSKLMQRQLWALLLEADVVSEMCECGGDGRGAAQAAEIGAKVRVELRDRGLDLDELCEDARRRLRAELSGESGEQPVTAADPSEGDVSRAIAEERERCASIIKYECDMVQGDDLDARYIRRVLSRVIERVRLGNA